MRSTCRAYRTSAHTTTGSALSSCHILAAAAGDGVQEANGSQRGESLPLLVKTMTNASAGCLLKMRMLRHSISKITVGEVDTVLCILPRVISGVKVYKYTAPACSGLLGLGFILDLEY